VSNLGLKGEAYQMGFIKQSIKQGEDKLMIPFLVLLVPENCQRAAARMSVNTQYKVLISLTLVIIGGLLHQLWQLEGS